MRKPRNLSREERELWQRVASRAEPLNGREQAPVVIQPAEQKPVSEPRQPRQQTLIAPFEIGASAGMTPPPQHLPDAPIRMDHKAWRKMKGGRLTPEARLDLHGLTLAQAHPRLSAFIETSAVQGRRLVLVITGKGRPGSDSSPIPSRSGVLRRQVPHWLDAMPVVLQITLANRKHGGEGALYVYLRRRRS